MNQIIINQKENKIEIGVVEGNQICEKYLHDVEKESILGNIYSGIVENVVDGMQAAFVNIGEERNAFIPVKDAFPKVDVAKEAFPQDITISEVVTPRSKAFSTSKKRTCE